MAERVCFEAYPDEIIALIDSLLDTGRGDLAEKATDAVLLAQARGSYRLGCLELTRHGEETVCVSNAGGCGDVLEELRQRLGGL